MLKEIQLKILNDFPRPYFGNTISDSVLSCFLEDAEMDFEGYLKEIEKAERGEDAPTGFTGNQMDVDFYSNKAVIEALWFNEEGVNDGENFATVEVSLSEAKQLLLDWKKTLEDWKKSKPA